MLSRQIASKLRGYETPFYLYDMALLRQTLESVVYESKKYGYKVHYAIKANYDDHLLAVIREYGLGVEQNDARVVRGAVGVSAIFGDAHMVGVACGFGVDNSLSAQRGVAYGRLQQHSGFALVGGVLAYAQKRARGVEQSADA